MPPATHGMESVPGAVATGLTLASSNDAATNDRFRIGLRPYPVATAPGTDLIPKLRHYLRIGRFETKG